MTRKEKMREARDNYIKYLLSTGHNYVSIDNMEALFEAGVKWCDANSPTPWISVKDDLPCNHEELTSAKCETKRVFILKDVFGNPDIDYMLKENGKWRWFGYNGTKYWMPIPEAPKE